MKTREMTPKEKTAAFEAYCQANESADIRFTWRTKRNQFSGKWMFTLTVSPIPSHLKLYADIVQLNNGNSISRVCLTKHAALDYMFKLIMNSRSAHNLPTVDSFEEMALINAINGNEN